MTASASPSAPPLRPTPRMAFDIVRLGVAACAGLAWAGAAIGVIALSGGDPDRDWVIIALFAFSAGSSLFYLAHTLWVFGRVDGPTLKAWLLDSSPRGRFAQLGAELSGTGPTIAVQWSVVAVATVLVFTIWPSLLERSTTVWLSVLVVASSWAVTVLAYAVHYARLDSANDDLQFPDDHPRVFADYLYLSVQVQTTFSTSDVSLASTAARRIVTGHTLVSFAFNTVIIAMLITVLFLGAGGH